MTAPHVPLLWVYGWVPTSADRLGCVHCPNTFLTFFLGSRNQVQVLPLKHVARWRGWRHKIARGEFSLIDADLINPEKNATGGSPQAGPVEAPVHWPRITPRANLSAPVRTRFSLAKPSYLRGDFAGTVRFLLLSHEDARRAAQVKPGTWLTSQNLRAISAPICMHRAIAGCGTSPLKLPSANWLADWLRHN